jgi:hypothetical protein
MKHAFAFLAAVALPALLLALPSDGGQESITIEAENALPGIWRFPPHERRSVWTETGTDMAVRFEAVGPEKFCRIGRAGSRYLLNCLEIAERDPRARLLTGCRLYLSWTALFGVPGCRWTYEGRLVSNTEMSGRLGMRCGMVERLKPELMTLTKMALSERAPDPAGQKDYLRRLLQQMAAGRVTEPYAVARIVSSDPAITPLPEEAQQKLFLYPSPEVLRLLGSVTAIVYIGDYVPIVGWNYRDAVPVYSEKHAAAYAVEFENGERLCALQRRPDGVLDLLQCI